MAAWQTVRFDPSYEEPLDPEIVDLCDALNEAGFETTDSCCGHGADWPRVWWSGLVPDQRCEALARFLLDRFSFDYCPFTPWVSKGIEKVGHYWKLEIHLHRVFATTPPMETLREAIAAMWAVANAVREFKVR